MRVQQISFLIPDEREIAELKEKKEQLMRVVVECKYPDYYKNNIEAAIEIIEAEIKFSSEYYSNKCKFKSLYISRMRILENLHDIVRQYENVVSDELLNSVREIIRFLELPHYGLITLNI